MCQSTAGVLSVTQPVVKIDTDVVDGPHTGVPCTHTDPLPYKSRTEPGKELQDAASVDTAMGWSYPGVGCMRMDQLLYKKEPNYQKQPNCCQCNMVFNWESIRNGFSTDY